MIMPTPAMRRVAFELKQLTYDEMMTFAQGIAEHMGVHEHSVTGMSEDDLTTEVVAAHIAGWVDENLADEDRRT